MSSALIHKSSWRSGFTLIELLVTVGIIGLLAGLLIPGMGKYMESSRSARCMGNMKQIGTAFFAYANDNDGYIPSAANTAPDMNLVGNWFDDLTPYLAADKKGNLASDLANMRNSVVARMSCPTFRTKYINKSGFSTIWTGYGMNNRLFANTGDKSSTISKRYRPGTLEHSSTTILVAEGSGLNFDLATAYTFTKQSDALEGWKLGGTPDRHGKTSNYLFLDGHLEALGQAAAEASFYRPPQS